MKKRPIKTNEFVVKGLGATATTSTAATAVD